MDRVSCVSLICPADAGVWGKRFLDIVVFSFHSSRTWLVLHYYIWNITLCKCLQLIKFKYKCTFKWIDRNTHCSRCRVTESNSASRLFNRSTWYIEFLCFYCSSLSSSHRHVCASEQHLRLSCRTVLREGSTSARCALEVLEVSRLVPSDCQLFCIFSSGANLG